MSKWWLVSLGAVALYLVVPIAGLRFYLNELIFIGSPKTPTCEDTKVSIFSGKNEETIRIYGSTKNNSCIVFFPGQHGGISRYEQELFPNFLDEGFTVYALSYPSYDGSKGKATLQNAANLSTQAIIKISEISSCKIENMVFCGRSIGAVIALLSIKSEKPKGILLDSIAISLSRVLEHKIRSKWYLKPIGVIPIKNVLQYNIFARDLLKKANKVPISIFQGELDACSNPHEVRKAVKDFSNVNVFSVMKGTHSNAHVLAGRDYIKEAVRLGKY
jgi:predicted esterase